MKVSIPDGIYLVHFGYGTLEGNVMIHIGGVDDAYHFLKSTLETIRQQFEIDGIKIPDHAGQEVIIRSIQRIGDAV